ncbi:hypothetical protein A3C37_01875 [Candidatus Peribacteria bacterium RIFCSPHIGHO2_02_FULL_53_20]|nr:MAG: hypothetical protein A3C37_01875 [Candidatus Peribacteria bacterium RIFCSPHIGHO2_02_FULL_53_20]OGJ65816.1 MAG: hypothetical protein A3B61_01790 [Candidatus Peribacteria bacterium RIFCSPLOWO2_01_FULL_53_10]OGJ71099.1 MAG: hypothetical protein A3G69_00040 [Candidatus Peribacteria bacterium RIFCSPLOWO2_12_FULL_53_10]
MRLEFPRWQGLEGLYAHTIFPAQDSSCALLPENDIGCLLLVCHFFARAKKWQKETRSRYRESAYASPLAVLEMQTRSSLRLVTQTVHFLRTALGMHDGTFPDATDDFFLKMKQEIKINFRGIQSKIALSSWERVG